jgi:hypothetical protein
LKSSAGSIPAASISARRASPSGSGGGLFPAHSAAALAPPLRRATPRLRLRRVPAEPTATRDQPVLPPAATYDADVGEVLSKEEFEALHCWEAEDQVPRRPEMTQFRRRLRYHQAQWREANGHPIASQPIAPRPDGGSVRLVGSRLPLAYASETGANFLTARALDAARARTSIIEPHQSFDHQRLWADLLSSVSMGFNLFGDLAAILGLADRAVHT